MSNWFGGSGRAGGFDRAFIEGGGSGQGEKEQKRYGGSVREETTERGVRFNGDVSRWLGQNSPRVLLLEREIEFLKENKCFSRRGRVAGGGRSRLRFKTGGFVPREKIGGGGGGGHAEVYSGGFSSEMAISISVSRIEYLRRTRLFFSIKIIIRLDQFLFLRVWE